MTDEKKLVIRMMAGTVADVDELRPGYQGRFHVEAFGFVTDNPLKLGAAIALAYLEEHQGLDPEDPFSVMEELEIQDLLPQRQDAMGLSRIYY